jgi:hypothetical protein
MTKYALKGGSKCFQWTTKTTIGNRFSGNLLIMFPIHVAVCSLSIIFISV